MVGNTPTTGNFNDNALYADELAALVKIGHKRATANAFWAHDEEQGTLLKIGDYSVIIKWEGEA